jgi:hypothetical protein
VPWLILRFGLTNLKFRHAQSAAAVHVLQYISIFLFSPRRVYYCRPFPKFRAFLDRCKTDPRGVISYRKSLRNLRLGVRFETVQERSKFRKRPTKKYSNLDFDRNRPNTEIQLLRIGRGSLLPKEFTKIWSFLVLFLRDYLCNQIFGFVSALKPKRLIC